MTPAAGAAAGFFGQDVIFAMFVRFAGGGGRFAVAAAAAAPMVVFGGGGGGRRSSACAHSVVFALFAASGRVVGVGGVSSVAFVSLLCFVRFGRDGGDSTHQFVLVRGNSRGLLLLAL